MKKKLIQNILVIYITVFNTTLFSRDAIFFASVKKRPDLIFDTMIDRYINIFLYIYIRKANIDGSICVFDTEALYNLSIFFFFMLSLLPNISTSHVAVKSDLLVCFGLESGHYIFQQLFFMTQIFLFRSHEGIFHRFFGKWS